MLATCWSVRAGGSIAPARVTVGRTQRIRRIRGTGRDRAGDREVARSTCGASCRAGSTSCSHDDVVFYSPIVYTPQEGKAITKLYLQAAGQTLPGDEAAGRRRRPSRQRQRRRRVPLHEAGAGGRHRGARVRDHGRGQVRQRRRHHPLRRRGPHRRVPGDDPSAAGHQPGAPADGRHARADEAGGLTSAVSEGRTPLRRAAPRRHAPALRPAARDGRRAAVVGRSPRPLDGPRLGGWPSRSPTTPCRPASSRACTRVGRGGAAR